MLTIQFDYQFHAGQPRGVQLNNPMFRLLDSIHRTGSIGRTADEVGLSYRHVWGQLKKWEETLGAELILWERGKRARLTQFGEKLLFAEQMAKARLLPQIDNMAGEMERAFTLAFDSGAYVIALHASHDLALNRLKDFMASEAKLHLNVQYFGSMACLEALTRGECMLAGFHVSEDRARGTLTQKTFKKLLRPGKHKLINFLGRQQGLIVAAGNPKRIQGLADLTKPGTRFINREPSSGTRLEIEQLLQKEGIMSKSINGFDRSEKTHLAVAAAVASNQADAGFGIRAAAAQQGLDFIPLVREQYYFACLKQTLDAPAIQRLITVLRSDGWRGAIDDLTGYDTARAGEVVSLKQAMPWYSFRQPKLVKSV